jgi:hypothetical protein
MTDTDKASGGRTRRAAGTATAAPRAAARGGTGRVVKTPVHTTPVLAPPPGGFHEPTVYVVRTGEDPWTEAELRELRDGLMETAHELRAEIAVSENGIADLLRDSGEGAGDDQADTGAAPVGEGATPPGRRYIWGLRVVCFGHRQGTPPGVPACDPVCDLQTARRAPVAAEAAGGASEDWSEPSAAERNNGAARSRRTRRGSPSPGRRRVGRATTSRPNPPAGAPASTSPS